MPIERSELERLQRETNDALGRLVLELRENRPAGVEAQASPVEAARVDEQPLRDVSDALGRTTSAMQQLTDGLGANVGALRDAANAFASGRQGLLGAVTGGLADGGGLGSFLSSGFGLAPVASALLGLFRGGNDREEEPVFEPVTAPPAIRLEAGLASREYAPVSRGAGNEVRAVERTPAPQVVVNVSAMDSQSFLTRSHDIARAVRDAMLHMDPLNDVIGEL
jgi:hypothetical protein